MAKIAHGQSISHDAILDVDIGNTFTKWRWRGECNVERQLTRELIAKGWAGASLRPKRICVACVAGESAAEAFRVEVFKQGTKPDLRFAAVAQNMGGISPCYEDVTRLGVDRWLAMLAAFNRYQTSCVVVSAGSAITADWLSADGLHLGGMIAPGRDRLAASLQHDLAGVLRAAEQPVQRSQSVLVLEGSNGGSQGLVLGSDTASCCAAGIDAYLTGFLSQVLRQHSGAQVLFCGGDSHALFSLCPPEEKKRIQTRRHLVLDGLAIALP